LDKKGLVKFKTQSEVGKTKELDLKNGDTIKINVFQVTRMTSRNKRIPFPLKKEFVFKIE
jgi:hypothetical protein